MSFVIKQETNQDPSTEAYRLGPSIPKICKREKSAIVCPTVKEEILDESLKFDEDEANSIRISGADDTDSSSIFKRVNDDDAYIECTLCYKKLKQSSIRQHYRTHAGLRPHHCDICGSRFTRRGDVVRHKRVVHKKVRPYTCRKCNKLFSFKSLLVTHLQNHDKSVYYDCETCNYKFGKREYYENHIRYIHPLPDGVVPNFEKEDEAEVQLREIEQESNLEDEESISDDNQDNNGIEFQDSDADEVTAMEEDNNDDEEEEEEEEEEVDEAGLEESTCSSDNLKKKNDASDGISSVELRTVSQMGSDTDDVINKVLEAAVNQGRAALQSMAWSSSFNQLGDENYDQVTKTRVKASVDGEIKEFAVEIIAEKEFDIESQAGIEVIVNIINEVCAGKGNLDGHIEIEYTNKSHSEYDET